MTAFCDVAPKPKTTKTSGNIEFLQTYPVVAVNALLEIGTYVIQLFCRSKEHLLETLSVYRNVVISRCIVVLFGTALLGYALLNTSRRAANDFDTK
jgi:hypothetical protein